MAVRSGHLRLGSEGGRWRAHAPASPAGPPGVDAGAWAPRRRRRRSVV